MKRNTALHKTMLGMNSLIFSVFIPFASLCCFITAFEFHIPGDRYAELLPVDLHGLLFFCLLAGVLFTLCNLCKLSALVPLLFVIYGLFLWWQKDLWLCIRALFFVTARRFNNAYNSGIPYWCIVTETEINLQPILSLLACFYVAVTAWAVCHKQSAFWILSFGLLYFIPCIVMTNTVPNPSFLILLAVMVFLYLLTQWNRTHASPHGLGLTLYLAIPVSLLLILLFSAQPMEDYEGAERAREILHSLQNRFHGTSVISGKGVGNAKSNIVELSKVGNMIQRENPVMEVKALRSGTYYIRGKAFDIYTGTQWKCIDPNSEGAVTELPAELSMYYAVDGNQDITFRTRYIEEVFYFPFYRGDVLWNHTGSFLGFYPNLQDIREYSYDFSAQNEPDPSVALNHVQFDTYTALPDSTKQWAGEFLAGLPEENVRNILNYLKSYGSYDLNTDRMPPGTADFAQWFLESSDTGYCVHYATAATVLLRCAGIPARYITGYMIEVNSNEETTVYEKDAHAWVEYWNSANGCWEIMEATPSSGVQSETSSATTDTQPTTTSENTEEITLHTTNTPVPTETEAPTLNISIKNPVSGSNQKNAFSKLLRGLGMFVLYLFPIFALWVQWKLRVKLRRVTRNKGTNNEKAVFCWKEVRIYSYRLGKKPPRPLLTLAERAKFSPYKIRTEELAQFHSYLDKAVKDLRKKSWYSRLVDRLIFALY